MPDPQAKPLLFPAREVLQLLSRVMSVSYGEGTVRDIKMKVELTNCLPFTHFQIHDCHVV